MTLHWWMHWFWVTYFLILCCCRSVRMHQNLVDTDVANGPPNSHDPIPPNATEPISTAPRPPLKAPKSYNKRPTHAIAPPTTTPLVPTVIENATSHTPNATFPPNITFDVDDLYNQSRMVNSEQIGASTPYSGGLTVARITGVTVGFIGFIGVLSVAIFIMYRNSTLNRPQVLNDHCSNPDSSGYIDDSIPENSEEMYSLDNDSFLNSLEAMTIQNLWTVSVKHTKL